jgi:hypothetical protein
VACEAAHLEFHDFVVLKTIARPVCKMTLSFLWSFGRMLSLMQLLIQWATGGCLYFLVYTLPSYVTCTTQRRSPESS